MLNVIFFFFLCLIQSSKNDSLFHCSCLRGEIHLSIHGVRGFQGALFFFPSCSSSVKVCSFFLCSQIVAIIGFVSAMLGDIMITSILVWFL